MAQLVLTVGLIVTVLAALLQFGIERAVPSYAEDNGGYWGVLAIGTTATLIIAGLVECLG